MTASNITPMYANKQIALIDTPNFIKEIVRVALQEYLEEEITDHIGADPYERNDERTGLRNGYKDRTLKLKVGSISLRIPQTRDGSFHTGLFERYQRSERAFTAAIVEMWIKGVSNRKVSAITEELSSVAFSKSAVSEMCKMLDGQTEAWRSRGLSAHTWPYLFVDAIYEHVRKDGMVVRESMLIVSGIRDDGLREILDVTVADIESEATYGDLFSSLKERGLTGVRLVTSDAHAGLRAAICRYFQGAAWQRCQVHFLREAQGKVLLKYRKELSADISEIFEASSKKKAMKKALEVADRRQKSAPRVASMIDEGIEDCLSVLGFPKEHQVHIRTNNPMERLNREIRRRDRVIGIFPNEASALRLICALCMEQSEEWIITGPCLDMSLLEPEGKAAFTKLQPTEPDKMKKAS